MEIYVLQFIMWARAGIRASIYLQLKALIGQIEIAQLHVQDTHTVVMCFTDLRLLSIEINTLSRRKLGSQFIN